MIPDTVVLHPGVQHSADVACAVFAQDRLLGLYTGLQVGRDPRFPWNSALLRGLVSRRVHASLPDEKILRIRPWATAAARGMRRLPHAQARIQSWLDEDAFARRAIRLLPPETRVAIGTDFSSGPLFRRLRAQRPDVLRVLDVSHPNDLARRRLLDRDAERWGLRPEHYDDYVGLPPADQHDEFALADLVVVASAFSASVLPDVVDREKVRVVPYGVPVSDTPVTRTANRPGRVLFVGALSERKGLSHLWRAAAELAPEGVHIDVVGHVAGRYRLPKSLPPNTTVRQGVSSASIRELMDAADLFVLPSMCEGFGRVLLESLARGLPVLTTNTSGGPDILERVPQAPLTVIDVDERARLAEHMRAALRRPVADLASWFPAFAREMGDDSYRDRWGALLAEASFS